MHMCLSAESGCVAELAENTSSPALLFFFFNLMDIDAA